MVGFLRGGRPAHRESFFGRRRRPHEAHDDPWRLVTRLTAANQPASSDFCQRASSQMNNQDELRLALRDRVRQRIERDPGWFAFEDEIGTVMILGGREALPRLLRMVFPCLVSSDEERALL